MIGIGRERVDARLFKMKGVWGTAFSHKIEDKNDTGKICLTVFVGKKICSEKLVKADTIPKWVTIEGIRYATDVVEMSSDEESQSTHTPSYSHTIADQNSRSALSGFAKNREGFFALSCAHSMTGIDKNPHNPQRIEVRNSKSGKWTRLGSNIRAIYGKGFGTKDNYGFSDAAIVKIEHPDARYLINNLKSKESLQLLRLPSSKEESKSLIGKPVVGVGRLMRKTSAVIALIYFRSKVSGRYIDLAIKRTDNGSLTKKGDSGMLWYTFDGKVVAMHAIGKKKRGASSAYVSLCMFATRIVKELRVELLRP